MIQIDLVTGFLGSGKTTFLKKYAEYLVSQGFHVGIIENDFGAVNIDMLMLQDLLGDRIDVEQIVGGSVVTDWKRRFRTKLISMAMRGFNRILVEPSGIYDVDAFFDVLHDEPIDAWYEAGNIITILDANMDEQLSRQEEYLMVSQSANAGKILLSKTQDSSPQAMQNTISHLNRIMEQFKCPRRFSLPPDALRLHDHPFSSSSDNTAAPVPADMIVSDRVDIFPDASEHTAAPISDASVIFCKPWDDLTEADFASIASCGWVRADHEKLWFDPKKAFSSLFFMHVKCSQEELKNAVTKIFEAKDLGTVFRIKGYLPLPEGDWLQLNATPGNLITQRVPIGQEILIVIGQDLQESALKPYFFPTA